jgi:type 2 lantibiotic biosynthesis protein LanM
MSQQPASTNAVSQTRSVIPNGTPRHTASDQHDLLLQTVEQHPFLSVIEPALERGRSRLRAGVLELRQVSSGLHLAADGLQRLFMRNVVGRLNAMLDRVMVLELHVARLQDRLEGETSEERFWSFVRLLHEPGTRRSILEEYPVLARQVIICINQWVEASLEFLRRLCTDWQAVGCEFGFDRATDELVSLDGGVGDRHRNGRSVLIAQFASGNKVVYKPRSLAGDLHFQQLLAWVNQRGDHPPFRTLKVLDRGNYGWVEFVSSHGCESLPEVERFYRRQGGYLAILYALQANDLHSENIIAAGEHPVLLDLETVFHPSPGDMNPKDAEQHAASTMGASVLRVGLLPQRLWSTAESKGVDISGLGGQGGQFWPFDVPYWESKGTDEMRLERKRMKVAVSQNRPSVDERDVDVSEFAESFVAGFTDVYQLLLDHRDELLARGGPLAWFADDEIRVVLRPTQTYAVLHDRSLHPDFLRDALDRDRLFDNLWACVPDCPWLARVTGAECREMHRGDIPVFTTRVDSRDLQTSSGERIADFFYESGMERVRCNLRRLGPADRERQIWFIKASLAPESSGASRNQRPLPSLPRSRTAVDRGQLLAAARAIGDRLVALAQRGKHDATWIGFTGSGNDDGCAILPFGPDLYDGLSGVVLFLAYLGAATTETCYTDLAQCAMTTLRRQLVLADEAMPTIGGFSGWGGVIYTLTHLGALWERPHLFSEAERLVPRFTPLIKKDEHLDIIAGSAGCLASLLGLLRHVSSERILDAARQCGDRLLAGAEPRGRGIGWPAKVVASQPLTGFSHGAAGIASVLLELAEVTGEDRYRQVARDAVAYERSVYSPQEKNWPDFRVGDRATDAPPTAVEPTFMTAWCHGAPGIGLARLRSLPYMDDAETRREIQVALQTTLHSGFGSNHCLCHGDLGNIEFLHTAGESLGLPAWTSRTHRLANTILESLNRYGPTCGTPHGVETPGLMTGIAGIGYGLLRLADPQRIPSVLMLEPPGVRGGP